MTSTPPFTSRDTAFGVRATLRSPSAVSLGTPTITSESSVSFSLYLSPGGGETEEVCRWRLLLRFDDDLALIAVPDARRGDVGVVGESQVDDATLVGRHGFQGDGPSAVRDPLGDPAGQVSERVVATLLVARHVHEQVHALAHPLGADEADYELQRAQRLTPTTDQQTGVLTIDLDDGAVHLLVVRLLEVNGGQYVHSLDEVFQHLGGDSREVRGLLDEGDPDPCGLSADAEDARLAAVNDVDFDLAALGV